MLIIKIVHWPRTNKNIYYVSLKYKKLTVKSFSDKYLLTFLLQFDILIGRLLIDCKINFAILSNIETKTSIIYRIQFIIKISNKVKVFQLKN